MVVGRLEETKTIWRVVQPGAHGTCYQSVGVVEMGCQLIYIYNTYSSPISRDWAMLQRVITEVGFLKSPLPRLPAHVFAFHQMKE